MKLIISYDLHATEQTALPQLMKMNKH